MSEITIGEILEDLRVAEEVASTIGFALWDRRTVLRPALERSEGVSVREEKVERVLREYAREEPRLAEILQRAGML